MRTQAKPFAATTLALALCSMTFGADAREDPALRARIEQSCKRFLDFYAGLQRDGGWACLYHHPTLWAFAAGERHLLKSPGTVDFAKGGFTASKVMGMYLPAYEVFRDARYLDAARGSGDVLVKGQCPNGVLQAHYFTFPDGRVEPMREGNSIEMPGDEGPAPAVIMLVWIARLTDDAKYRQAAIRCAELYIRAQHPNGSWAQKFNLRTGQPGGLGYGVLNDGATTEPMNIMLLMYHMTQDAKFLAPVVKAGDWFVRAQNRQGGIPGWAEQYDHQDRPCWARSFEPPAICAGSTGQATRALLNMYRLTRDEKYLAPLRFLATWVREHPREKWGHYTDPKTAEPIHAANRKIIPGGNATALRTSGWVKEAAHPAYDPKRIERLIRDTIRDVQNPPTPPPIEQQRKGWRQIFWTQAPAFEQAIATQNAQGYWVGEGAWKDRAMQCVSCVTYRDVPRMLKALHLLAGAEGRVPPYAVGTSRWIRRAWPVADWFDTPLRRGK